MLSLGTEDGSDKEEEDKRMRRVPGAIMIGFKEKSHLSCQSLSFLLEKLIPISIPADMIPRLQESAGMNRSRCTVWGFYHCRSDWIPQFRGEFFFFFTGQRSYLFQKAGPVTRNLALVVPL